MSSKTASCCECHTRHTHPHIHKKNITMLLCTNVKSSVQFSTENVPISSQINDGWREHDEAEKQATPESVQCRCEFSMRNTFYKFRNMLYVLRTCIDATRLVFSLVNQLPNHWLQKCVVYAQWAGQIKETIMINFNLNRNIVQLTAHRTAKWAQLHFENCVFLIFGNKSFALRIVRPIHANNTR